MCYKSCSFFPLVFQLWNYIDFLKLHTQVDNAVYEFCLRIIKRAIKKGFRWREGWEQQKGIWWEHTTEKREWGLAMSPQTVSDECLKVNGLYWILFSKQKCHVGVSHSLQDLAKCMERRKVDQHSNLGSASYESCKLGQIISILWMLMLTFAKWK